jgi:hypothetical protein
MVEVQLPLGVRAIDALLPCGRGQRLGIFAGSGVGKSSLLSMIARGTEADISVIALVGERGREVREMIEHDLGTAGLARSVVVVATSDEPALVRLQAAQTATRIAEWFRDSGQHVVLMMDSLTRYCTAQREVGLSAGEPPATRGYPPSVFSLMPRLLERAGAGERGSITGLYTVLVEGDDMNEPIADAARAILDGHIVLSRRLATSGHFPSIDVLESVSRVAPRVTTAEHYAQAVELRRLMAAYRDAKDLVEIGAYVKGTNASVDRACPPSKSRNCGAALPEPGWPSDLGDRMKRYRFKLEAVLRARRVQEGVARAALVAANSATRATELAAKEALDHYQQVAKKPGEDFMADRERATLAAKSFFQANESYKLAKAAAEAVVAEYLEARRQVAMLDRLDERQRAEHALAVQHEETVLADELATNRNRRKRATARP